MMNVHQKKGGHSGRELQRGMTVKTRRTQAERSEAMRELLIKATLECLVTDGYTGLTIGRIVETARVSRGAPLHHFANKAGLIEAAAEALINRLSHKVTAAYRHSQDAEDQMQAFVLTVWREVYSGSDGVMLAEILHASRHEPELAVIVNRLWSRSYRITSRVAARYFQTHHPEITPGRTVILTQWLMRGLAQDIHLGAPPALFEKYLRLWVDLVRLSVESVPVESAPEEQVSAAR